MRGSSSAARLMARRRRQNSDSPATEEEQQQFRTLVILECCALALGLTATVLAVWISITQLNLMATQNDLLQRQTDIVESQVEQQLAQARLDTLARQPNFAAWTQETEWRDAQYQTENLTVIGNAAFMMPGSQELDVVYLLSLHVEDPAADEEAQQYWLPIRGYFSAFQETVDENRVQYQWTGNRNLSRVDGWNTQVQTAFADSGVQYRIDGVETVARVRYVNLLGLNQVEYASSNAQWPASELQRLWDNPELLTGTRQDPLALSQTADPLIAFIEANLSEPS